MLLTLRITTEAGQSVGRRFLEGFPRNDEDERSMGTLLLHDPWVRLYLLYVAALFVACILDCLRNPPAI